MATHECLVVAIDNVTEHPNAERLSIVKIGGYSCISGKLEDGSPRYKAGDLVVYIPEDSLLPNWLLKEMDFWNTQTDKGGLSGPDGNRVKAIKLRGEISQGVLYPVIGGKIKEIPVVVGDNVAEILEIEKFIPTIPASMRGDTVYIGSENTFSFDIENIKKWYAVFEEGEQVYFTEKLHGSFCAVGVTVENEKLHNGKVWVASKGLGKAGIVLADTEENRLSNVHYRTTLQAGVLDKVQKWSETSGKKIIIMGEVFGPGVQDLNYGQKEISFRAFDIIFDGQYLNANSMLNMCKAMEIDTVPVLYNGPYSVDICKEYTNGKTTLGQQHIREGIVVRPMIEREFRRLGRVILKSVSEDYLLRKNGTEFT